MNTPEQTQALQVQTPKAKEITRVTDDSEISYMLDSAKFEHCYRIAGAMARASLIPKHLKGDSLEQTQANCFLIVNQAMRWKLDPFAVAPETYEVGGKLGFQGKLVAAVINTRGGLSKKLSYTFNGKTGDDLACVVSGTLDGEDAPREVTVTVRECRTPNQMWTKDPQQKLIYTGAVKWARRHKPEVILGVITDDDADQIRQEARLIAAVNVTPKFEAKKSIPATVVDASVIEPEARNQEVETEVYPEPVPNPTAQQPAQKTAEELKPEDSSPANLLALRSAMMKHEVTDAQLVLFCSRKNLTKPSAHGKEVGSLTLDDIQSGKIEPLTRNILANGAMLKEIKSINL